MSNLESLRPECVNPQGKRTSVAYHRYFSNFHHDLYRELIELISVEQNDGNFHNRRFPIGYDKEHSDGSSFYAILDRNDAPSPDVVIAPTWFAPPLADSLFHLCEMANAATQSGTCNGILTNRFLAVFPYAELRQDRNSPPHLQTYWSERTHEAISAQIFANSTISNGVTEAIFLDPHSEKAMSHFSSIETLCLTSAPAYATWLVDNQILSDDMTILALDLGAVQRCQHLATVLQAMTGIDIPITVLDKHRTGHSIVEKQNLIFGDPRGKRVIIFDDIAASIGSIKKTAESLTQFGAQEIIALIPHGVLIGKYVENITAARKLGAVSNFVITNSLPKSSDAEFLPIGIEILSITRMLAYFSRYAAMHGIQATLRHPNHRPYIMTPKSKAVVKQELLILAQQQGDEEAIGKIQSISID